MKKSIIIFAAAAACAALFASQTARAQVKLDDEYDFRGRISAEIEKEIIDGLSVSVSEEVRLRDKFTDLDRFMTTAYISYKPISYVKVGLGWSMINATEDNPFEEVDSKYLWKIRQRLFVDVTGMYKVGGWRFSVRERLQSTVRPGDFNNFQNPRHEIALRSRAKVAYNFGQLQPYVLLDLKTLLNEVNPDSLPRTKAEIETAEVKYNDAYVSRVRVSPGLEYKITKRHSLDFYILADYCMDKTIDTNAEGRLKQVTVQTADGTVEKRDAIFYQNYFNTSIGVGYKFSF